MKRNTLDLQYWISDFRELSDCFLLPLYYCKVFILQPKAP